MRFMIFFLAVPNSPHWVVAQTISPTRLGSWLMNSVFAQTLDSSVAELMQAIPPVDKVCLCSLWAPGQGRLCWSTTHPKFDAPWEEVKRAFYPQLPTVPADLQGLRKEENLEEIFWTLEVAQHQPTEAKNGSYGPDFSRQFDPKTDTMKCMWHLPPRVGNRALSYPSDGVAHHINQGICPSCGSQAHCVGHHQKL